MKWKIQNSLNIQIYIPIIVFRNSILEMRTDKENQFSSFSKLLTKIDATNLGQYELKVLKQQHQYLDRLRQQRMKIQELKRKYDECENQLTLQRDNSSHLSAILQQKCQQVEALESELESERLKRQSVQKRMQKSLESDKLKTKSRLKQIQNENQQLKKMVRQKELIIISMQQQHTQRLKKCKETFQAEKRSLLIQLDQKMSEIKAKNTENELTELRNLVTRQNKILKSQDQKHEKIITMNESMFAQLEQLRSDYKTKCEECDQYEERINQMYEQLENAQGRLEKQDQNNRLKGQLEQLRRKMTDMQKGQIERIQFIVNQLE